MTINYSVEDFKKLFSRGEFSFLPIYSLEKVYMKLDEVYYTENRHFYVSNTDYNEGKSPVEFTQDWTETIDREDDYVLDSDIERAFAEARANFNESIFETQELKDLAFNYLTAHYLCIDSRNANGSGGTGAVFMAQSKSVGNVSASYAIPERFLKNPYFAFLAQTGFGNKYLSYIIPRSVARCIWVEGRSLP